MDDVYDNFFVPVNSVAIVNMSPNNKFYTMQCTGWLSYGTWGETSNKRTEVCSQQLDSLIWLWATQSLGLHRCLRLKFEWKAKGIKEFRKKRTWIRLSDVGREIWRGVEESDKR